MFAQVALDVRVFDVLTYRVPDAMQEVIRAGQLIHVPFRNQRKTGLIIGFSDAPPADVPVEKVRDVLDIVDVDPVADDNMMSFLAFLAEYYFAPFSEVLRVAIPSSIRSEGSKFYDRNPDFPGSLSPELAFAMTFVETSISVAELREKSGVTFLDLKTLEEKGAVTVRYEDVNKVSEKKTKLYEVVQFSFDGRLGEKQKALLEYLHRRGAPVEISELRELYAGATTSLKGLEKKGLVRSWEETRYRDPFDTEPPERVEYALSPDQQVAFGAISDAVSADRFSGFLLHGVTGSGKTEVYLRVIREVLAAGKSAIVLLPEIALTPQFVAVFRSAFEGEIAVLHSGLSAAQKFDQWRQIRSGDLKIVIGARSALFAPVRNIGVIVVDEEHDPSFKQEEGIRYNARDMALVRGQKEGAVVVLGSATPALETYQNATTGKLTYLKMPTRISDRPLPSVRIVDLRETERVAGADFLSQPLFEQLNTVLTEEEQAILFLNRRGFSPCILCGVCGHMWRCPSCDVSLTYHRYQEALRCHHCDYLIRLPEHCPECENRNLGPKGVGTEQLADVVSSIVAGSRVARLDRDAGRGKKMQNVLTSFSSGESNVLVGTQMVTKGHDFPNVTLVGVVHADTGLNFPDFRGAERTFQLLTQVAGRAGRGQSKGNVIVQTYVPEHFSLRAASNHDYARFAEEELHRREMFGFPPFGYLIAVKFEGGRESAVMSEARKWSTACKREIRKGGFDNVIVRGPTVAPFEKLRDKYRWQMLVQSPSRSAVREVVGRAMSDDAIRGVRVVVDVDPLNLL